MKQESAIERIKRCQEIVEQDPSSAITHYKLALAYTHAGRMDSAAAAYRKALEIDPAMAKAWVNLGGALFLKWDFKGAIEANEKALGVDPDLPEAHFGMGQARLYLDQPEEVLVCNRRVVEIDPEHGAGHYFCAVALLATGEVGRARESFSKSMKYGHRPRPEFLRELEKAEKRERLTSELASPADENQ